MGQNVYVIFEACASARVFARSRLNWNDTECACFTDLHIRECFSELDFFPANLDIGTQTTLT